MEPIGWTVIGKAGKMIKFLTPQYFIFRIQYRFYKEGKTDKVWWADRRWGLERGPLYISFDKKNIYNLWPDYPWKLTSEEKEIFDKEQPFWANYFSGRNKKDNSPSVGNAQSREDSPSVRYAKNWENYFSGKDRLI